MAKSRKQGPANPKRLVGYIRGRWETPTRPSEDTIIQGKLIEDYAKRKKATLVATFGDKNPVSLKEPPTAFADAMGKANKEEASIVYLGLKNYRPNVFLTHFVTKDQDRLSKDKNAEPLFIELRPTEGLLKAVKAYSEKDRRAYLRPRKPKRKKTLAESIIDEAKANNIPISPQRLHNFAYLIRGDHSVHSIFIMNTHMSNSELAKEMNRLNRKTVYGKKWTKDNVHKTRQLMNSEDFEMFLEFVNQLYIDVADDE